MDKTLKKLLLQIKEIIDSTEQLDAVRQNWNQALENDNALTEIYSLVEDYLEEDNSLRLSP